MPKIFHLWQGVTLTENERNYLHEKYEDCLCDNCMKELKIEFHNNQFNKN